MKLIPILLVAGILCGCASSGRKIDETKVDQIKRGITTKEEVLKLIGSPETITKDADGNVTFLYHYVYAQTKGSTFIPIVGMFAGGVDTKQQGVTVRFDPTGLVTGVETSMGASDISQNAAASQSSKELRPVTDQKRAK